MRRLTLLALWAWTAAAAPLTVLTWNLQWFPSGTPSRAPEEAELARIREAAAVIRAVAPDVVVVQEVRDFDAARRLAREVGGLTVAVCSRFPDFGGTVGWQQVAILAREDALLSWSEEWETERRVEAPRGFAFAWFRAGTNDVAVYGVHFKSNLAREPSEESRQTNERKRELAARQLMRHLENTENSLRERFEIVVVAGDFNTNLDDFPDEATLTELAGAGFTSGFEAVPRPERITRPGQGRHPDATFDYIYVRGVKAYAPMIVPALISDHFPVQRTLVLR